MKKRITGIVIAFFCVLAGFVVIYIIEPEYAYMPSDDNVMNKHTDMKGYDKWGKHYSDKKSEKLLKTANGDQLSSFEGAVKVDDELLKVGKETFYKETFGNEVFLTDIMGILDGPLTAVNMMKAILQLKGEGTNNLQVELAEDFTVGDQTYKKGEKIDTGIDVARGTYAPLGMPVKWQNGKLKVGISCAACHATVDRDNHKIIEGAPNDDLSTGLVMALATNSASYFTHAQISSLKDYIMDSERTVETTTGEKDILPDPELLEAAVDEVLLKWPPGNFDSTIDMKSNPAQIPDSFTIGDHPYGWSGFAMAGPFNGLSTFSNNVHAQNSDSLSQAEASNALFNIDKEVYLGTILQNAANPKFRYNPSRDNRKPSEFFASVDPTPGVPGVNELVAPPQFPKLSLVAPDGLIASAPGYDFNEQNNGVAAWQNTIRPPKPKKIKVDKATVDQGRDVFTQAGCISCHAGKYLTNNRIVSAKEIKTEPSRAKAFKKTEKIFGESVLYAPHTRVPLPQNPDVVNVPTGQFDKHQIQLGFAHGDSEGGYKTPSLLGLYWTAPYLHDGGVAVGKDAKNDLGMPGTLMIGKPADPKNSLRALVDKNLRQKVIAANRSAKSLQDAHVQGVGHEFWVDETTGFTREEQDALIDYLLTLEIME